MVINNEQFEGINCDLTTDEVAALLVKLYGEYIRSCGGFGETQNNYYAKAVGIAVRMLSD